MTLHVTCDLCLTAKHQRCGGRGDCACELCGKKKRAPKPKVRAAAKAGSIRQPREKVPRGPRQRKRSYPAELVAQASVLRTVENLSWREIADRLEVPLEGMRYAVMAYAPEISDEDLGKAHTNQRLKELGEQLETAKHLLVELERLSDTARDAMQDLRLDYNQLWALQNSMRYDTARSTELVDPPNSSISSGQVPI